MYTPEEIAESYKKMDDAELVKFASTQARTLRKDVVKVLKKEIESRNLDASLLSWIDSEAQDFIGLERESLLQKIKGSQCPNCGVCADLNGYEFTRITSYLIRCVQRKYTLIICSSCGRKEKWTTIGLNFLLGWWSKYGLFITPYTIIKDLLNFFFIKRISSRILEEFIDVNTGYFRRNGTDKKTVSTSIKNYNILQKGAK